MAIINNESSAERFLVTTGMEFLNPRAGNRPASIKGTDGNFYTISDAAFDAYQPYLNTQVQLTYIEQSGNTPGYPPFKNITHLNGAEMPRDQRRKAAAPTSNNVQRLPVSSAPAPRPAAPAPIAELGDVMPGRCGILKSAIEAGKTLEEAKKWIELGLDISSVVASSAPPAQAPAPPPPAPGPPPPPPEIINVSTVLVPG